VIALESEIMMQFSADTHFVIDTVMPMRDSRVWGDDATVFRPSRWRQLTPEQRATYLPFGAMGYVLLLSSDD
jgi:cytochrome P450